MRLCVCVSVSSLRIYKYIHIILAQSAKSITYFIHSSVRNQFATLLLKGTLCVHVFFSLLRCISLCSQQQSRKMKSDSANDNAMFRMKQMLFGWNWKRWNESLTAVNSNCYIAEFLGLSRRRHSSTEYVLIGNRLISPIINEFNLFQRIWSSPKLCTEWVQSVDQTDCKEHRT